MRNVRPSWVSIAVEGRSKPIATGPKARNGDLSATFFARRDGSSVRFLTIRAEASEDGTTVDWIIYTEDGRILLQETVPQ